MRVIENTVVTVADGCAVSASSVLDVAQQRDVLDALLKHTAADGAGISIPGACKYCFHDTHLCIPRTAVVDGASWRQFVLPCASCNRPVCLCAHPDGYSWVHVRRNEPVGTGAVCYSPCCALSKSYASRLIKRYLRDGNTISFAPAPCCPFTIGRAADICIGESEDGCVYSVARDDSMVTIRASNRVLYTICCKAGSADTDDAARARYYICADTVFDLLIRPIQPTRIHITTHDGQHCRFARSGRQAPTQRVPQRQQHHAS
jgi:hypothetical protein